MKISRLKEIQKLVAGFNNASEAELFFAYSEEERGDWIFGLSSGELCEVFPKLSEDGRREMLRRLGAEKKYEMFEKFDISYKGSFFLSFEDDDRNHLISYLLEDDYISRGLYKFANILFEALSKTLQDESRKAQLQDLFHSLSTENRRYFIRDLESPWLQMWFLALDQAGRHDMFLYHERTGPTNLFDRFGDGCAVLFQGLNEKDRLTLLTRLSAVQFYRLLSSLTAAEREGLDKLIRDFPSDQGELF